MAFLGYSEDFDLDDDGILRDSTESGGILIDDDGIVRDDFDLLSKHGSSTHWTDSGLGGDKPASTPSTLRQLDLQSYPSFEDVSRNFDDDISRNFDDDVSRNFDESNVNISDLEASKDDLSFDDDYDKGVRDRDYYGDVSRSKGDRSGLSSRSSFDHSLNYDVSQGEGGQQGRDHQGELFSEEYYRQLQELGVLVDQDDLANPRESLQEFESLEHHYSRDFEEEEDKVGDAIEDFLKRERQTPTRDSMDIEMPDDRNENKSGLYENSQGFDDNYYQRGDYVSEDRRTRPNTASSTRTISSRSFPEISPEEALELYGGGKAHIDGDSFSLNFDQSQRTDDDEIYFIPSQEHDKESPTPAKVPAYDIENKPSMTPKDRGHRLDRSRSDRSDRSRSDQSSEGSRSVTPQSESQYVNQEEGVYSEGSRSVTPQPGGPQLHEEQGYHSEDRNDSLTQVSRLDSRKDPPTDTDSFRPDSALSELSSAASEGRAVRPKTQKVTKKPPKQKSNLSHAKSEQSFFDMEMTGTKRVEKGPKRLLPKPAPGEESQSFKVKSKSTTNIAALGGPVKPTHMSISEIRNIIDDDYEGPDPDQAEGKSQASDVPKGELSQKLRQESSKRQQATQLVKQLQEDYDKLLSKYALAELTINQMRLGTKISLHAASPTPSQATSGSLQSAQHLQLLQLSAAQRGIVAPSPQQPTQTVFFPEGFQGPPAPPGDGDGRAVQQRGTSPAVLPRSDSTNSMDSTSTPRGEVEQPGGIANDAEKVKLGLLFQARNLDERMQSFQALLGEGQLTVEEQEGVFDKIRVNHEKLRSDYLQSKEDYTALRRSTPAAADLNFDQEKELEGELFRLGMKFDEIHEQVEENLKQKSPTRQPFQGTRRHSSDSGADSTEGDPATENMKRKMMETRAGADLLEPRAEPEFEEKVAKLQEEYNALMARYRRIREMASSRDRDKEIDNLVKKLTKICDEEPKLFKLPAELQERTEKKVQESKPPTIEKRRLPEPKSSKLGAANTAGKSPAKSYEILTASETWSLAESMDRWERSKQLDQAADRSRSRDNLNTSAASSTVFRNDSASKRGQDEPDSRLKHKDRTGSYNSISSRGRNTPDSGRGRHTPDSGKGRHSPDSTSARGRYSPESSRGRHTPDSSYNDRNSPVPSLPRPRRHDYPDRERRERRDLKKSPDRLGESTASSVATDSGIASLYTPRLKRKKPEGGSTTSLQDSGISEHEGATGPNSPLSKLPGPGKFKQMTGRREPDTDSGFIGSMVGSEVSAGNLSNRRQPQQAPLRLRHPGDSGRPSSRQSNRSDDSAAATTPRSARSQASSRSSRRTPTKAFPLTDSKQQQQQQETKPEARTKTPTREGSRSKSRDQVTQHSRDYTDDSYTSVTESEMSFDSDMRGRRRHSHGSRRNSAQRQIEKIAEDSEEENYSVDPTLNETTDINLSWVTSDSERASVKQSKRQLALQQTPKKKQESTTKPSGPTAKRSTESRPQPLGPKAGGSGQRQGRASRMTTDDDTTTTMSTLSPTRVDTTADVTQDTTDDTYTSDGTTPRSVIERERKAAKKSAHKTEVKRQASPGAQIPPRTITPVQASRSEVHPGKLYASQDQGPAVKAPPTSHIPGMPKYMDRSIGSAADETILASDAETAVTRGSINRQPVQQGPTSNKPEENYPSFPELEATHFDGRLVKVDAGKMEQLARNRIGKGSFGETFTCKVCINKKVEEMVIKKISCKESGENLSSAIREKLASRIKHQFIVPVLAFAEDEKNEIFYFMMPYLKNGDLRGARKKYKKGMPNKPNWEERNTRLRILVQLAVVIKYLHQEVPEFRDPYVHGDISSANIVFDEEYNMRLLDFGTSKEMKGRKSGTTGKLSNLPGTDGYQPRDHEMNTGRDCWSWAAIALELLTGEPAAGNDSTDTWLMEEKLINIKRRIETSIWGEVGDKNCVNDILKIVEKCKKFEEDAAGIVEMMKKIVDDTSVTRDERNYKKLLQNDKCLICMLNPKVRSDILDHKTENHEVDVDVCAACLRNSYLNPIQCPFCLEDLCSPIGTKWAALLFAGNDVKDEKETVHEADKAEKAAKAFKGDAEKVYDAITSKRRHAVGIRKEYVKRVYPAEPGKKDELMPQLREALNSLKSADVNTLFIYFSGHTNNDKDFILGHNKETISEKKLNDELSELLSIKITKLIIILDYCYPKQSGNYHSRYEYPNSKLTILKLTACRPDEKAHTHIEDGSDFTNFLVQCLSCNVTDTECFGYKSQPSKCPHCFDTTLANKCSDGFISLDYIHEYCGRHMITQKPMIFKKNVTWQTPKVAYYRPILPPITLQLNGKVPVDMNSLPESKDILMKMLHSIFEEIPNMNRTHSKHFLDVYAIVVQTGRKSEDQLERCEMAQIESAWDGHCELHVLPRNIKNIKNGKVGFFLDSSAHPIQVIMDIVSKDFGRSSSNEGATIAVKVPLTQLQTLHDSDWMPLGDEKANKCLVYLQSAVLNFIIKSYTKKGKTGDLVFTFHRDNSSEEEYERFFSVELDTDETQAGQ